RLIGTTELGDEAGGRRLSGGVCRVLAQRHRTAVGQRIHLETRRLVVIAQQSTEGVGVEPAVLIFQKERRSPPAAQGGIPSGGMFAETTGEVNLAAVLGPPAGVDRTLGQAARDTVPVLADDADITDGSYLANLLIHPAGAGRLNGEGLFR